jgi:aspartokinase
MRHNLSLKVKCAFTEEKGTHICHSAEGSVERMRGRAAAGIAHQTDYALLRLNICSVSDQTAFWRLVGGVRIAANYSLTGECLTITGNRLAIEELAAAVSETGAEITELIGNCAQLSLVGGDPNTMSETAIRFLGSLKANGKQVRNLEVRQSVISGLVPEEQLVDAAGAVHQEFFGNGIEGGN